MLGRSRNSGKFLSKGCAATCTCSRAALPAAAAALVSVAPLAALSVNESSSQCAPPPGARAAAGAVAGDGAAMARPLLPARCTGSGGCAAGGGGPAPVVGSVPPPQQPTAPPELLGPAAGSAAPGSAGSCGGRPWPVGTPSGPRGGSPAAARASSRASKTAAAAASRSCALPVASRTRRGQCEPPCRSAGSCCRAAPVCCAMRVMTSPPQPMAAPKCSVGSRSRVVLLASCRTIRSSSTSCSTWICSLIGAPAISRMASLGWNGGTGASFTETRASSRSLPILLPRLPITHAVSFFAISTVTARSLPFPCSRGTRSAWAVGPSRMSKCFSSRAPKRVRSTSSSWTLETANSMSRSVGPVMRTRFCSARPLTGSRTTCKSHLVSSMILLMRTPFSPMR
mmetsp:Transcript_10493/g.32588  ORF Transcript_10493/g.32588 Transcript_10493/m.32588 type:complete len:397 (-) Transcript_10493:421-1611(-)